MSSVLPYHAKDLSQLPAPDVLESLDYETLLADRSAALNGLYPLVIEDGQPVVKEAELIQTETETYWKVPVDENAGLYYVDLDSDPATRLLQADVYREMLLRNRVNKAALSTMIAYASGSDLDNLAANQGVERLTVSAATDTSDAVLESDTALRKRVLLAAEGLAAGGSNGWYLLNTLSADGLVKDAYVYSPSPCVIEITILSHEGNGAASDELVQTVSDYVNGQYMRVMGDQVTVKSAEIVHYALQADVYFYPGASNQTVIDTINEKWSEYRAQSERISHIIAQSAVDAVLHQAGVYRALVTQPSLPIVVTRDQAPYCIGFEINEVTG